ncbi:MAG: hypothetical protein R3B48_29410 [Kofleriaceae bacterium]
MDLSIERGLRIVVGLACAAVLGMLGIFVATGVGQDPLQYVHPPAHYRELLLAAPPLLRATLALDNLFVVFYATAFALLARLLLRAGADPMLVKVAIGLIALVAALDLVENFHFLVMLAQAEHGLRPSSSEIGAQVLESLLKFHVSYLALFLLSFVLPRTTRRGRLLANLGWFVQLPVGVLIYVAPAALAVPLVFVRFTYFVVALLLLAGLFPLAPRAPARPGAAG